MTSRLASQVLSTPVAAVLLALLPASPAASEERLTWQLGPVELRARVGLLVQGAIFDDPATGRRDEDGAVDAFFVGNAQWVTPNGLLLGAHLEVDSGERVADDLQRDEFYVYLAGEFGRFELGEQDGPADTISLHAPVVGLGQVRGDFARYAGSPALLSPLDTQDAFKLVYLAPPWRGVRVGVSYAPEYEIDADAPDPRARTRQVDAFEIGAAWQAPVGSWALGVSGAWVGATADPITQREDIRAWSVGAEMTREQFTLGGAYVRRGDSNRLARGFDQEEVNAGVRWREATWSVGLSWAETRSTALRNRLVGLGVSYDWRDYFVVRADLVHLDEQPAVGPGSDGYVIVTEFGVRF